MSDEIDMGAEDRTEQALSNLLAKAEQKIASLERENKALTERLAKLNAEGCCCDSEPDAHECRQAAALREANAKLTNDLRNLMVNFNSEVEKVDLMMARAEKSESSCMALKAAWDKVRSRVLCTVDPACFEHLASDAIAAVQAMDAALSTAPAPSEAAKEVDLSK